MRRLLVLLLVCSMFGCGPDHPAPPSVITDMTLSSVQPEVVLPETRISIEGSGFFPEFAGVSRLRFRGTLSGIDVDFAIPLRFIDYGHYDVIWPGAQQLGLPTETGVLIGEATVETDNILDGRLHDSAPLPIAMALAADLVPRVDGVQNETLFVNDPIVAIGGNFLFGGSEGETVAIVQGQFTNEETKQTKTVGPVEVPTWPLVIHDRSRIVFPFAPSVAGIAPGSFDGSVFFVNRHGPAAGGVEHPTGAISLKHSTIAPRISSSSPGSASLGQFVDIRGGGFVGSPNDSDAVTTLLIEGTWTEKNKPATAVSLELVTEASSGQLARYVLSEQDALGKRVPMRSSRGTIEGTVRARTRFGKEQVDGPTSPFKLAIAPVRQIVWLRFLPAYVESLRRFGMRSSDSAIRARIVQVVFEAFGGVGLDVRTERPEDFKLFAEVEIAGPDPNGLGLIGYDNTPGKDEGNARLSDKIGGVNALTQEDGYPGYGGVFVESLFGFSEHPNGIASSLEGADPDFDRLFDAFRPDRGGNRITANEMLAFEPLVNGNACPAEQRSDRIPCAVWALGSLIGTTVAHEIAHSLGLADPGGSAFHNSDDFEGALMDAGPLRSFTERAEIRGVGPGVFCQHNFAYLQSILPTELPDPLSTRPVCF